MQVLEVFKYAPDFPPAPASSVYHGWVTRGCASWSFLMRWRTSMMYAIIAKGYPWITPFLLCKKWPDPSSVSRTTRVYQ